MPKFSVVIPTKDRLDVLLETVNHTLATQNHSLFEIVIADNSTDSRLYNFIRKNPIQNVRYIKTGGLSMADNWEQAYFCAAGEYIIPIGDKIRLRPDALDCIDRAIKSSGAPLLCWKVSAEEQRTPVKYSADQISSISSEFFYAKCCQSDIAFMYSSAPSSYRICIKREYYKILRGKYQSFCHPIAPDFTSCFLAVLNTNLYHMYDDILVYRGRSAGNGFSAYYSGPLLQTFMRDYGVDELGCVSSAPLRVFTTNNCMMSDFVKISKMCGRDTVDHDINPKKYAMMLFHDLMITKCRFHIDVTGQLKLLYGFMETNGLFEDRDIQKMFDNFDTSACGSRLNLLYVTRNTWSRIVQRLNTKMRTT